MVDPVRLKPRRPCPICGKPALQKFHPFCSARCAQVDLRGSRLSVARGVEGLAGATVDPVQLIELAPQLAQRLGLRVSPVHG